MEEKQLSVNQKNVAMVDLNNRLLDTIRELENKGKNKPKKQLGIFLKIWTWQRKNLSKKLKKKMTLKKKRNVRMDQEERDLAGVNPQAIANLTPNEESNMLMEVDNGLTSTSSISSSDVMWGAGQPNIVRQPVNLDVPSSSSQSTDYFEGVEENSVSAFGF